MGILRASAVLLIAAGCTWTSHTNTATSLPGPGGRRVMHINTESFAIHFALSSPFLGNAKLDRTHERLMEEARKAGAVSVEVTDSKIASYWYIVFPLTLLFTPVQTRVTANVDLGPAEEESER